VPYGTTVLTDELARRKRPIEVALTAGDVRFSLWLPTDRPKWPNYQRLSKRGEVYEPVMLACLTRLLQKAATPRFMDLGAYLGYYACYVSAWFGGSREVYAVESNPLYADAVRESARLNGFSNLRIFQVALSDRIEPVNIHELAVRHKGDPRGATTTLTLDQLCERERLRPTIIKMDVHGAEGKIVLGMRRVLAGVECILVEMHSLSWLRDYSPGITRTAMLDALEESGLTLYYMAGHADPVELGPDFQQLLREEAFYYRKLDQENRHLLLFDGHDKFVLGLRHHDIECVLGPSISPANA